MVHLYIQQPEWRVYNDKFYTWTEKVIEWDFLYQFSDFYLGLYLYFLLIVKFELFVQKVYIIILVGHLDWCVLKPSLLPCNHLIRMLVTNRI